MRGRWAGQPIRDQEPAMWTLGRSSWVEASVLGACSSAGALPWVASPSRVAPGRPAAARVQHGRATPAVRVQPRLLLLEDLPQPRGAERPQVRALRSRVRLAWALGQLTGFTCVHRRENVCLVCACVPWSLGLCYGLL